ncbi:MAG: ribosome small subunit-dependent GTPase A [Clostridia bacterium]|nr:ribosome small subunit-dependent GTPase A [Clostridia bacterium]
MIKGTVLKGLGGLYTVRLDQEYNGLTEVSVRGRGSFRHDKLVLLTGDRVILEPQADGSYFCKEILERKNSLIRPPLANLDIIFVVIPCKRPMPSFEIIDKMIAIAEHNKIDPVILITKADLDGDFAQNVKRIYENSGFTALVTSSESQEGVGTVREYLKSRAVNEAPICAFAGVSGAGKSTLMNAIFPTLCLETGDLSQKIERGKNTTRHTELFSLSQLFGEEYKGYLADTPGFSLLDFERFDFFGLEDLFNNFRDFRASEGRCKYTKCSHTKEEGCDVLSRVKRGEIEKTRHESYCALYEILKKKPSWKK